MFLGVQEKLGGVTGAIIRAMGCQSEVGVVFESRLLRFNENFLKVAASCAQEGEGARGGGVLLTLSWSIGSGALGELDSGDRYTTS